MASSDRSRPRPAYDIGVRKQDVQLRTVLTPVPAQMRRGPRWSAGSAAAILV